MIITLLRAEQIILLSEIHSSYQKHLLSVWCYDIYIYRFFIQDSLAYNSHSPYIFLL